MLHWNWGAASASLWDAAFVKKIQLCNKLVNLSFTNPPKSANVLLSRVDCQFSKPVQSHKNRRTSRLVPGSRIGHISSFHALKTCAFPEHWKLTNPELSDSATLVLFV